ncbi:MAG: Fe-S cluster assembly protein SufD [Tannerella sp.]|jgi:Fe-S cluster assembly protein SufD|nr:Fe-S cluster assembly protein SufD [Tannerella sp.]
MNAEKQYTDVFTQYRDIVWQNSSDCMNELRQGAFDDFVRLGFPSSKHEDFRYTDTAQAFAPDYGLNLRRFKTAINPADVFRCDVPNMSTQIFFVVNDSFYEDSLPRTSLPEGVYAGGLKAFSERFPDVASRYYGKAARTPDDSVAALNTMLAQDGFVLYVQSDVKLKRPIQLVNIFHSAVDIMANRRILIIMEPRSEARLLVCDHTMDDVRCLATQVVEIFAGEGVFFDYYDLEESTVSTTRFSSLYAEQSSRSNVLVNGITLTNGLSRNNYHIALNGEDAEATLCGMAILDGNQQLDTYTHITHRAPRCKSSELFKNVLDDKSTGVFSGRILVSPGADKTEAFQTNRNMCLTREARMFSKPQLEIYADDVKCSHGMSTGQLDEQALFYMQSRGLSRDEARTILSVAFTSDVVENVRMEALKERLRFLVEKRFRGELAQCAGCFCKQ